MRGGSLATTEVEAVCREWVGPDLQLRSAVELRGGSYNTTYRLEVSDGTRAVLRVAPPVDEQRPSERHLMRNEYASVPFLRPVADVMPTTLMADFTHRIIGRDYVIQSYLEGVPASNVLGSWSETAQAQLWRGIGQTLARIHAIKSDHFGRVMAPTTGRWSDCLVTGFELIARGCDELGIDGSDLRYVADLAAASSEVLDVVSTGSLLHGDLIPANVMVDPDDPGRGVIGIFDCDRTWWGDPLADWTLIFVERLPPVHRESFWDGYGETPTQSDEARRRRAFYRARSIGEIRLEHARLGKDRQAQKTYEMMSAVVEELVTK
ncbi:hypothetical protein GCM10022262_32950 [Georgenia daeguensis]|uniref:Aminoglycoside phosphotransferase domain-containing protein n=1 Tax=Georgenia daeguensis TaxID=908355 RepID=A0ABP8EY87_9MICO